MKRALEWIGFVVGFVIFAGFGTWQLQRLDEKRALIARIEARTTAAPEALATLLAGGAALADIEYRRVTVTGIFHSDREQLMLATDNGRPGWHLITPLATAHGQLVLVNRGFVPTEMRKPGADYSASGPVGAQTIIGLVRLSEQPGTFIPANAPADRIWYWRDIPGLIGAATAGLPGKPVPVLIDAAASAGAAAFPKGGTTRLAFPNRHLEYALTWYALAATLAAFTATVQIRRRRALRT